MTTTISQNAAGSMQALAGKYLTFTVGNGSYAINVRKVREIIRQTAITPLPQMPAHIRGVINLRGRIVPILDLRLRFGLAAGVNGDHTCIVVAQVESESGRRIEIGLVVDDVEEVVSLSPGEIEPPPEFGAQVAGEQLVGIATLKGMVKMLLDIDTVVAVDLAEQVCAAARQSSLSH